jgi:hypothetical protein
MRRVPGMVRAQGQSINSALPAIRLASALRAASTLMTRIAEHLQVSRIIAATACPLHDVVDGCGALSNATGAGESVTLANKLP